MARIYLVEDDVEVHSLLTMVLEVAGHDIGSCRDGREAAAAAAAFAPDLVLLDVALPGLDGLGVTRQLRLQATTAGVPIVLLTARARQEDVRAGLDAGATEYVTKPFDVDGLIALIDRLIPDRRSQTG